LDVTLLWHSKFFWKKKFVVEILNCTITKNMKKKNQGLNSENSGWVNFAISN